MLGNKDYVLFSCWLGIFASDLPKLFLRTYMMKSSKLTIGLRTLILFKGGLRKLTLGLRVPNLGLCELATDLSVLTLSLRELTLDPRVLTLGLIFVRELIVVLRELILDLRVLTLGLFL